MGDAGGEQTRGGREVRVERSGEAAQSHGSGSGSGRESDGQEREQASPWEWVTAAVSAVVVLGSIGFMTFEALTEPDSPPVIEISVDTVVEHSGSYLVQFQVHNTGQTTAAGLVIHGELKGDTGSVETAQVTLDFVPAESHRAGGLFFTHDPRQYRLEIHPKGYDRP